MSTLKVTALPAGSLSICALHKQGDTNTGIYFPAEDQLAIVLGGFAFLSCQAGLLNVNGHIVANSLAATGNINGLSVTSTDGGSLAQATDLVRGTLKTATEAQIDGGINTTTAITPQGLQYALGSSGAAAYAVFEGRGTNGACTILKSKNVTSVTRINAGEYTVVYDTPVADAHPIVSYDPTPHAHYTSATYKDPTDNGFTFIGKRLSFGGSGYCTGTAMADPTTGTFIVM